MWLLLRVLLYLLTFYVFSLFYMGEAPLLLATYVEICGLPMWSQDDYNSGGIKQSNISPVFGG